MLVLLTACGVETAAQAVNPVSEVTAEEMTEKTDMGFHAPRGAEDVRFYVIAGDPAAAQVTFTLDGKAYTYRAVNAVMDAGALSGVHFGKANAGKIMVFKAEADILTEEKTAVLYLLDKVPGISHSLTCMDCDDPNELALVAAEIFMRVWDDVPEMVGIFKDDNFDDVILNEVGDLYTATVGIYRLTTMDGTGVLTEDGIDLTLTDPSGGTMCATFNRNRGGTYTLTITDSTWSLLETGTSFQGFWKDSTG